MHASLVPLMRRAALLSIALLGACAPAWQGDLRRHVALQRGCPEDDVVIVADNGHRLGRQVRLDACGDSLMYEQVNAGASWEWRDITGSGDDAAPFVDGAAQ